MEALDTKHKEKKWYWDQKHMLLSSILKQVRRDEKVLLKIPQNQWIWWVCRMCKLVPLNEGKPIQWISWKLGFSEQ